MDFYKKNNWWLCLFLNVISFGLFYIVLANYLNLFDKDAWYMNKWYWIFGLLCLVFPAFIMLIVFSIQMNCKISAKFEISGSTIYNIPYSWILFIIIPIIGWVLFIIMYLYLFVMFHIKLYKGEGEKFI